MGTGGSFLHNPEDDDILGKDLDGSSRGVIKRIPIEIRPRGRLGLKSGSSRKPKGGSLSSALSVEIENTEVEKIRKEFEMYRYSQTCFGDYFY
jgi:nephrocystin-3